MIKEPDQHSIDQAFAGTNFGPEGDSPEGRKKIVARCVLQRACAFSSGGTITAICKELGLLTNAGAPRKHAKQWAFCFLHANSE